MIDSRDSMAPQALVKELSTGSLLHLAHWHTFTHTCPQEPGRREPQERGRGRYFLLEAYLGGGIGGRENGKPWKVLYRCLNYNRAWS